MDIIICLDIDGVMLDPAIASIVTKTFSEAMTRNQMRKILIRNFNSSALNNLNKLIQAIKDQGHEPSILLSSAWRLGSTVQQLQKLFSAHSFAKYIIGKTKDSIPLIKEHDRGKKIKEWLHEHQWLDIKNIIILDDNAFDIRTIFPNHFVQCRDGYFTKINFQDAIKILHDNLEFNPWNHKKLLFAARRGDVAAVKHLLVQNAHPNIAVMPSDLKQPNTLHGDTALHFACENQSYDIIHELYTHNATNPNAQKSDGTTALHIAAEKGDVFLVKLLLSFRKIDIGIRRSDGATPLHIATLNGHTDVTQELLKYHPAHINQPDHHGTTLLHLAAFCGHQAIVNMLLAHVKIQSHMKDNSGATPLYYAALKGHIEIFKTLITHDEALIDNPTSDGTTPFLAAAINNHTAIIDLLLSRRDIILKTRRSDGVNAFYMTAQHGNITLFHKLLPYFKQEINAPITANAEILLSFAKKINREHELRDLFETKLCTNTSAIKGFTPLHAAIFFDHAEIRAELLKIDSSMIECKTEAGMNALDFACALGYSDVAGMILTLNIDKIAQKTPAHTEAITKLKSLLNISRDATFASKIKDEYNCFMSIHTTLQKFDKSPLRINFIEALYRRYAQSAELKERLTIASEIKNLLPENARTDTTAIHTPYGFFAYANQSSPSALNEPNTKGSIFRTT